MNRASVAMYHKNLLQITRQVRYSPKNENSVDAVIFLNGLPIITMELKNPSSGQRYTDWIKLNDY